MATKVKTGVIDSSAITSALIANASITADDLHTTLDLTGKTVTVSTASAGDNDTSVASTAYVDVAIANLADSAPSTLNTLNELAAALGDDANYATTTTAAIAGKLPLAGGTMTGTTAHGDGVASTFGDSADLTISHAGGSTYLTNTTGSLILRSDSFRVLNTANSEQILHGTANGAVVAYYDNAVKLATTATGIDVTGSVNVSSNVIQANGNQHVIGVWGTSGLQLIGQTGADNTVGTMGANEPLAFRTGSTERMRIDSSGNVIVGGGNDTGFALTKLKTGSYSTTEAGINILTTPTGTAYLLFGDGTGAASYSGGIHYSHNTSSMSFRTLANYERMRIHSDGKTTFSHNVKISGASSYSAANLAEANNENMALHISPVRASVATGISIGDFGSVSGIQAYNNSTNAALSFVLNPFGGNVGIGTTSPDYNTEIEFAAGNHTQGLSITNSQAGGYGSSLYFTSERSDNNAHVNAARIFTQGQDSWNSEASADSNLFFATALNGSLNTRMTIKHDGNVGIGTTAPAKYLTVGNNLSTNATDKNIRINTYYGTQNTARGGMEWYDGAGTTGQIDTRYDGSTVDMHLGSLYSGGYNTTSRMIIKGSGPVTMPYQPAFAMTGSHGPGWINTVGVLNFATTITNIGSHYSTTTKRFTAPVAGVYSISATVLCSASAGGHTYIRKNLQPVANISHHSGSGTNEYNMAGHTVCIPLAVGDYVDVHLSTIYSGGSGIYCAGLYSSFSGFLVG